MILVTNLRCYRVHSKNIYEKLKSLRGSEEQIAFLVKKKNTEPLWINGKSIGSVRNPKYIGTTTPSYLEGYEIKPYYCKIGLYNVNNKRFQEQTFVFNSIIVDKIFFWEYEEDNISHELFSIFLKQDNREESVRMDFIDNISYFFNHAIKDIDNRIAQGENLYDINLEKYTGWIHDIYTPKHIFYKIEDAMMVIYNSKIYVEDNNYYEKGQLKIDLISRYYKNQYIYELCTIFCDNVKTIKKKDFTIYRGTVKEIPNADEYALEQHLYSDAEMKIRLCMYIDMYNYFDEINCDKSWYTNKVSALKVIHKIKYSNDLFYLYNIISRIKVWHYVDGATRVGRDDLEWDEYTYVLPLLSNHKIPDIVLCKINEELGINFRFEKDKSRYYYHYRGESDTIPGCCKREYCSDSKDISKKVFIRILILIFKMIEENQFSVDQ